MTKQEKVFVYFIGALAIFATTLEPQKAPADAWPQRATADAVAVHQEPAAHSGFSEEAVTPEPAPTVTVEQAASDLAPEPPAEQEPSTQSGMRSMSSGTAVPQGASGYTPRHGECAGILSAARDVGWPNWALSHLEPLMWRESRCQNEAWNENTNGTVDRGALQINSVHLELLREKKVLADLEELHDPHVNMRAALALYRFFGNSFCPWNPDGYCS